MTEEQFAEMLEQAGRLVAIDPALALAAARGLTVARSDPRGFRLTAAAHRALGSVGPAEDAELEAIKIGFTAELESAVSARESGRLQDSLVIASGALRRQPDDLLATTIAAEAALRLGDRVSAEQWLYQVVERAPGFTRAAFLLANLLAADTRLRDAIEIVDQLKKRVGADPAILRYLAGLRAQAGDYAEAADLYAQVIAADPGGHDDLIGHAQSLRALGRKSESIAAFRRATALAPQKGTAWWGLAQYYPEYLDDADMQHLRTTLAAPHLPPEEADLMRIALGILHGRRGNHEAAFRLVETVKESRRAHPPYDPATLSRHVDALIAGFTPMRFAARTVPATVGSSLIFIVGMPRSGSTLLERILSQHSAIEACGEIQVLPRLVAPHVTSGIKSVLPNNLSDEFLDELARGYAMRAGEFRRTNKPISTDKHIGNWIHAGLIRLMFPDARIVDVRRNPLDCCWSVYKMMFGDNFANDQRHLARYFADYARYIDAIDAAAPGGILTVSYERLVSDVEREIKRMLDFIGVGFEPACTAFHLSDESVATPSSEQVRRPLNRDGIGAAIPYRHWLAPMSDELSGRSVTFDQPA